MPPAAPAALPPPTAYLQPWQKLAIWGVIILGIVIILVLFSGKIQFVHQKVPAEPPLQVRKDINDGHLTYPAMQTRPDYAGPVKNAAFSAGSNISADQDRLDAANSPIAAFGGHGGGGPAGAPTAHPTGKPAPGSPGALEASLTPTTMDGTKVAELPDPTWLIEAGRILPCNQQTKIDSTLPGSVTALIPEAIRGETGNLVLLDKGAKVFGTIQRTLMNGADRLSVLWQHIDTPVLYDDRGMPHQFRIATNSPAAGELGETGLDGDVNRHLLQKIGGILGYSLIQGGIQAAIQSEMARSNGTQINLNSFQTGGNQAADELLRAWVEIPDVMTRDQGLHCSIAVVRDLDMRAAYNLRRKYRIRS